MSEEETFTSVPLVGFKFLSEIENIAYSRLVRAAYVKKEFVGWLSKKDAISKLSFLKKTAIYKIFKKLEELGLLEQKEKSYKVLVLSSTAKRENNKWIDTRVYLDDCNSSYKEYPSITTFESYKEVINEWTIKFSDKKIINNKIEQVCGFIKLSDKILYNTEIDLQNKIDWLRMRRIKDLEINTSKSEKPFIPNWKAVGTILGINGEMLRQRITSTICATKDKKGFITNYTSSNDGFSFDITDELVNSNYTKRTDNQKKISGIYKITNTITGDFYIGSSKDVKRRWREHKIHSTWNKCPNNPMYIDMRKYGLENFEFQVIEEIEIEKLKETEQKFIETLKPTYNSNRANGWNVERYKENQKEYYKSDKGKKYQKEFYKEYNNQLCSYNGEILTLQALSKRFQRAGIPHPQLEAKKYLIL